MSDPYQTPTSDTPTGDQFLSIPAIVVGVFVGFPLALGLAAVCGFTLWTLLHYTAIAHSKAAMFLALAVAVPIFVFPPYILCGYVAGRLAKRRVTLHAGIAGLILLVASNVAPQLNVSWSDFVRYASSLAMSFLGGRLSMRLNRTIKSDVSQQPV